MPQSAVKLPWTRKMVENKRVRTNSPAHANRQEIMARNLARCVVSKRVEHFHGDAQVLQ